MRAVNQEVIVVESPSVSSQFKKAREEMDL
jgi:hypothetical protein